MKKLIRFLWNFSVAFAEEMDSSRRRPRRITLRRRILDALFPPDDIAARARRARRAPAGRKAYRQQLRQPAGGKRMRGSE